eukprot:c17844_g1_i1 orf=142-1308(+)
MKNGGIALLIFMLAAAAGLVGAVITPDNCAQNVNIPELSFSTSPLSCEVVWSEFNFILRHHYDKSIQRLNIVLSANSASNWFSMGFSPTGAMIGSSALVGYMSFEGGDGVFNQYYLAGKTSNKVFVRQGNLTVVPKSGVVTLQNQTMYMAFQLDINELSAASSKVIYAYAFNGITPNSSGYIAGPHQATFGMSLDFTTGSSSSTSNPTEILRKSHGVVNIFAWAILVPVGAFIARYLRQRESLWFSLHVGFQITGYVLGITGVALGIKLTQELPTAHWKHHRIVGVFVLFLATLQMLAICARPNKDSKLRNLWSWYHFIVGRFVLLLAAVNIVIGLKIADAGRSWKAGYAFLLVITLLAFVILETIYWCKWFKKRRESRRPMTSYEMM